MSRFRSAVVAGAVAVLAGAAGVATAQPVSADPVIGVEVLNQLCVSKGGAMVSSPYTIARCQEARSNKGFERERSICDGSLGGTFQNVASPGLHNSTNWFCFATSGAGI